MRVTLIIFLALFLTSGLAQASSEPAMRIRHWQRKDGMPQGSGSAIAQTPDGYIWVVTYSGLTRFDGRRFESFEDQDSPVSDLGKSALYVSKRGELMITNLKGGIYALRARKFVRVAHFPGQSFECMGEDDAGDLWLINDQRSVVRARDGLTLPLQKSPKTAWSMLAACPEKQSQVLWILRDRELGLIKGGKFTEVDLPEADTVHGMGPAREKGLWMVFTDRLERWVDGTPVETIPVGAWPEVEKVSAVTETADGRIAVGTNEYGLFIFDRAGRRRHYDRSSGLADQWVMSLYVDREDSLWAGLANNGLNAFQPVTFETLAPPDQWSQRGLTHTMYDEEGLWVGTEGAGLYRWFAGTWEKVPIHPWANNYVWTMARDGVGDLWIGTWGSGLYARHGGEFVPHPEIEANYQTPAALLRARDGSFWAGSEQGLYHRSNGKTVVYGRELGVPLTMITVMAEDPDGAIWFGTSGMGLGRLKDGAMRFYRRSDGMLGENIKTLHFDDEGGLWIGSEQAGLSRYKDGAFRHIGPAEGLRARYIVHILDDGRGYWWLSTREGVLLVEKAALLRRAKGDETPLNVRTFTQDDGMPAPECSGWASMSPEGELFFATRGGLARTRAEKVVTNRVRPSVIIEELAVSGRADLTWEDGKPVVIPPGSERYIFSFTAPSFVATGNAAFRYKLDGVDRTWIEAGPERTATYSFLPPGEYVFRVMGSNGHGVWNDQPTTLQLIVLPFFWQTWWFQLLAYMGAALALGLTSIFVARRRWAKEMALLERKQALERERARIAKDIHDDLGASLTRINLLTQSAQREIDSSPRDASAHILHIGDTAREMTKTMDEIVWAVNPSHDSLDGIATYVAAYAQDFLGSAGIACRWNFPLTLPSWAISAEVRHNLFLAVKEAIHNVARHAHATRVDLTLQVEADRFQITVADNGAGGVQADATGSTRPTGGGNGIRNMSSRLEEIGGQCIITSTPGEGTAVRFSVPLKPDFITHE